MDLEIGSDPVPRPVPVVEPLLEEELPGATQSIIRKARSKLPGGEVSYWI